MGVARIWVTSAHSSNEFKEYRNGLTSSGRQIPQGFHFFPSLSSLTFPIFARSTAVAPHFHFPPSFFEVNRLRGSGWCGYAL